MKEINRNYPEPLTTKTHVSHILQKLAVRCRSEAKEAAKALRLV